MFPIEYKPTWQVIDSSKLDAFQRCPRYFFYKYVLGWKLDIPAHDLVFGEAWHRAREVQLLEGYHEIPNAMHAFEDYYRQYFTPEDDAIYRPKDANGALNALNTFAHERYDDLDHNEVVELDGVKATEIAGTVPIDEDRCLHYRMDVIMRRRDDGRIFVWDHKTTSEKYIVGRQWGEQFHLSIQNGTYTHCLYCLFEIEEVLGLEFCGTGFAYLTRGSAQRPAGYHCTLRRVPAYKDPDQMNSWLWTVNDLYSQVQREMSRLHDCQDSDPTLMAFPMNGTSCTDYRGCEFHDYCLAWQNPLRACHEPPIGFTEEHWDPSAREAHVRKDLSWKGGA